MNYIHLTIEERACISKFKEMNMSLREMAKHLNRNVSTISRELKRNSYKTGINNSVTRYVPTYANRKYKKIRTKILFPHICVIIILTIFIVHFIYICIIFI